MPVCYETALETQIIQLRIKGHFKKDLSKEIYILITSFAEQGY